MQKNLSRRNFIKYLGGGAVAATVPAKLTFKSDYTRPYDPGKQYSCLHNELKIIFKDYNIPATTKTVAYKSAFNKWNKNNPLLSDIIEGRTTTKEAHDEIFAKYLGWHNIYPSLINRTEEDKVREAQYKLITGQRTIPSGSLLMNPIFFGGFMYLLGHSMDFKPMPKRPVVISPENQGPEPKELLRSTVVDMFTYMLPWKKPPKDMTCSEYERKRRKETGEPEIGRRGFLFRGSNRLTFGIFGSLLGLSMATANQSVHEETKEAVFVDNIVSQVFGKDELK